MEYGLAVLLAVILAVVIIVAISRWIFRINDIIYNLELIVALLEDQFELPDKPGKKQRITDHVKKS